MYSVTRNGLEDFNNSQEFELMCAAILHNEEYDNVTPIAPNGGPDGGVDITFTTRDGRKGIAWVTLRKDISIKFRDDLRKRQRGDADLYYLFTTARTKAGEKENFIKECEDRLDADLVIQDLEALRIYLETPRNYHLRE